MENNAFEERNVKIRHPLEKYRWKIHVAENMLAKHLQPINLKSLK